MRHWLWTICSFKGKVKGKVSITGEGPQVVTNETSCYSVAKMTKMVKMKMMKTLTIQWWDTFRSCRCRTPRTTAAASGSSTRSWSPPPFPHFSWASCGDKMTVLIDFSEWSFGLILMHIFVTGWVTQDGKIIMMVVLFWISLHAQKVNDVCF